MTGQIKGKFDSVTLKKIWLEALKLALIAFGLAGLNYLLGIDWCSVFPAQYCGLVNALSIPAIRWLIGVIEQYNKGDAVIKEIEGVAFIGNPRE